MPVSKKRKKAGKPVQRHPQSGEQTTGTDHPEGHPSHPQMKSGKPKNPFITAQPQVRGAQRGR